MSRQCSADTSPRTKLAAACVLSDRSLSSSYNFRFFWTYSVKLTVSAGVPEPASSLNPSRAMTWRARAGQRCVAVQSDAHTLSTSFLNTKIDLAAFASAATTQYLRAQVSRDTTRRLTHAHITRLQPNQKSNPFVLNFVVRISTLILQSQI